MELFFARQPIFNVAEEVVGYEVAHRPAGGTDFPEVAPKDVDARVLVEAVMGAGLKRLGEGRRVFMKVTPEVLTSETIGLISPGTIVFEIDAADPVDATLFEACTSLRAAGHKLSLGNYACDAPGDALLSLMHAVKLRVGQRSDLELAPAATRATQQGRILIAEQVHERGTRDRCVALGVRFFQGYGFTQPETVVRRDLDMNHLAIFHAMRDLLDPTISDREIEHVFARDVHLSYRLLRIVNSAAVGGTEIWSIAHAIRLLGRVALYRWLSMCLLASHSGRGVTEELHRATLVRAHWCESLAAACGVPRAAPSLFLVGLFSLLDVITGVTMPDLLRQIQPASDVRAALLERRDWFGAALALVEAWEDGDWPEVLNRSAELGVAPTALPTLYREALDWADAQSAMAAAAAAAAAA